MQLFISKTVVYFDSVVFPSCFPLCLAQPASLPADVQKENTAFRCQKLSAAFYQLSCIPPFSPPANSISNDMSKT